MAASAVKERLRQYYKCLFFTDESEFKLAKGVLGFIVGLFLGAATFVAFRYALEFSLLVSAIAGGVFGLILAIALASNTYSRAVVCLCMPTLSLKSGRLVLSTIIVSLLLAGPTMNLSKNASEVASIPACSGELLYNQSLIIRRLAREPVVQFKREMKETLGRMNDDLSRLRDNWNAVAVVVRNPLVRRVSGGITNAVNEIDRSLNVDIRIRHNIGSEVDQIPSRDELVTAIKESIAEKLRTLDEILLYINRVLSLFVLIVVIQSALYLKKYKQPKIDFNDNQYITKQFVQLDEQRKKEAKSSLLPLTPLERKLVTDKRQKSMSVLEKKALRTALIPAVITIICGLAVTAGDYFLYESILFVREQSSFRIEIGLDASIKVNRVYEDQKEFFVDIDNDRVINTAECLPGGSPPNIHLYISIGVAYVVLVVVVAFQAYLLRLRRMIASYFYPQAEKFKINALYRKLLQERAITVQRIQDEFRHHKKRQKEARRTRMPKTNFISAKVQRLKNWLSKCKCYICQRPESKSVKIKECESCHQFACQECMEILFEGPTCLCLKNRQLNYDDVPEPQFYVKRHRKTTPKEVSV